MKHLNLGNRIVFDRKTIGNCFNEYFVNVELKLTSEIREPQISFEKSLTAPL